MCNSLVVLIGDGNVVQTSAAAIVQLFSLGKEYIAGRVCFVNVMAVSKATDKLLRLLQANAKALSANENAMPP